MQKRGSHITLLSDRRQTELQPVCTLQQCSRCCYREVFWTKQEYQVAYAFLPLRSLPCKWPLVADQTNPLFVMSRILIVRLMLGYKCKSFNSGMFLSAKVQVCNAAYVANDSVQQLKSYRCTDLQMYGMRIGNVSLVFLVTALRGALFDRQATLLFAELQQLSELLPPQHHCVKPGQGSTVSLFVQPIKLVLELEVV